MESTKTAKRSQSDLLKDKLMTTQVDSERAAMTSPRQDDVTNASPQLSPASAASSDKCASERDDVFATAFKPPTSSLLTSSAAARHIQQQVAASNPLLAAQALSAQKCFNPYELAHVMHLRAVAAAQFQQAYLEQRLFEKQRSLFSSPPQKPLVTARRPSDADIIRSSVTSHDNRKRARVRSFAIDDILQKPKDAGV